LYNVKNLSGGGCAYRCARRRSWRSLFRVSLENAAPGRPGRSVRTESGRCHLGLRRGVLRTGAGIFTRRRSGDGRRDRAGHGELEQYHAEPARPVGRYRRRWIFLDRPAAASQDLAAAGGRRRRDAAIRDAIPLSRPVFRLRHDCRGGWSELTGAAVLRSSPGTAPPSGSRRCRRHSSPPSRAPSAPITTASHRR
jgi:hypothetical protein